MLQSWKFRKNQKLKERSQFKYIGKETKRQDIPLKTAGKTGYGLDVEIPGMVYAVPVHSPYIHARVDTLDDTEARKCQNHRHHPYRKG